MSEWKPSKPLEVYDSEIESVLLGVAEQVAPDVYGRHDSSRQTNRFTESGVLLPKLTVIESAGFIKEVDPDRPLDRDVLNTALKSVGEDVSAVTNSFAESNIDITPILRASLEIGEGTENNLPWYHAEQFVTLKDYEALVELLGGWTSEEATHGELVELVMTSAGLYDERKSVSTQTALLRGGIGVATMSLAAINAYTDPQERLTFVAHQSSARLAGESGGKALLKLAGQENRHKTMFRALGRALYSSNDPEIIDYLLQMEASVMADFDMPGSKSYPSYGRIAKILANSGLFTFDHMIESFAERADSLGFQKLEASSDEAKKAQTWILDYVQPDSALHQRERDALGKMRSRHERDCKQAGTTPFIVGETVEIDKNEFKPVA